MQDSLNIATLISKSSTSPHTEMMNMMPISIQLEEQEGEAVVQGEVVELRGSSGAGVVDLLQGQGVGSTIVLIQRPQEENREETVSIIEFNN